MVSASVGKNLTAGTSFSFCLIDLSSSLAERRSFFKPAMAFKTKQEHSQSNGQVMRLRKLSQVFIALGLAVFCNSFKI